MDAHGRSVCPSSTYHPRSTNTMEADRRADVEITVILSSFPLEIVVCKNKEKENEEGYSSSDVNPIISFKTSLQRVMDDDRLIRVGIQREKWSCGKTRDLEASFVFSFINFRLISLHRLRSCSSFYITRPVKTPPSQLQPPRLLLHSLSRFPFLHCPAAPQKRWSNQSLRNGERN
jgi:hypothetical protein